jgi:hypothetical protein
LKDVLAQRLSKAVMVRPGRTSTQRFPLFSYLTFSQPDRPETDPVVVGVDFAFQAEGLLVRGDIAGEESGQVFFSGKEEVVKAPSLPGVLEAAREVANHLVAQGQGVLQALFTAPGETSTPAAQAPALQPGGLLGGEEARK